MGKATGVGSTGQTTPVLGFAKARTRGTGPWVFLFGPCCQIKKETNNCMQLLFLNAHYKLIFAGFLIIWNSFDFVSLSPSRTNMIRAVNPWNFQSWCAPTIWPSIGASWNLYKDFWGPQMRFSKWLLHLIWLYRNGIMTMTAIPHPANRQVYCNSLSPDGIPCSSPLSDVTFWQAPHGRRIGEMEGWCTQIIPYIDFWYANPNVVS